MTIAGHLVGVSEDRFGAVLTSALAIGDTVVQVDSSVFFNEEEGGTLLVGGAKLGYQPFDTDDDPDADGPTELTLTSTSTVDADEGDSVWEFDPTTGDDDPVAENVALVTIDDRDPGDAIPARIRAGLTDQLDSDFETYLGKAVELDVIDGELVLVDILGSKRTGTVKGKATDTMQVTLPGQQTMFLTYQPLRETEHLRWDGDSQPFASFDRVGYEVTIPDPAGALRLGDILTMQYLYTDPTRYVPPPPAVEFIGFTSVGGLSFDEIPLPDGTEEGDLLILAGVHGFFGGSDIINTNDPRMTMTYQTLEDFGSHWHAMCAYGFADGTNDAVLITGADPTSDVVALLATYRVVGSRWLRSTLEGGVCAPPMPSPADLGIMIVANSAGPGGPSLHHDLDGGWTLDASDAATSQSVSVWSCQTGAPDAHLVQADDSDLADIWAYLAIGFV